MSTLVLGTATGCAGIEAQPERAEPTPHTAKVAHALSSPVSGSDIVAQRAFVGDPLRGLGLGQAGSLYQLASDDPAAMASTTKSFTLLLAVEAVAAGKVSLNDIVTISLKAADIDHAHTSVSHSEAGFPAGEQVRFEDLLYAMMLPSGGDASIAVGQHVAVKTYPYLASESDAAQEAAFVTMMNTRAAELGLTQTTFHNPYGGDHFHADDNTPGAKVEHRTSTRDMVRWFDQGMKSTLFRTVAGFQGTYAFNAVDGTPYSFGQSFSYPGLRAQKGGSNEDCGTCLVADAKRVGRDLLVAYTQGAGGDGTTLLDYGFAELFHPAAQATGPTYTDGWSKNALACVTSTRAVSVVVEAAGTLRFLLWGLDLGAGSIVRRNPVVVPEGPGGFAGLRGGGGGGGGGLQASGSLAIGGPDPDPASPTFVTVVPSPGPAAADDVVFGGPTPLITNARVAYAGNGNLVVAADTSLGVYLYSYGIMANDSVVLRDTEFVGAGNTSRVFVPNSSLVVTAHRDGATGTLALKSWQLNTSTGKLSNPLDTATGSPTSVDELEITGRPGLSTQYHVVVGLRHKFGKRVVQSYVVSSAGAIEAKDSLTYDGTISHVAVAQVPGFGTSRDVYALTFRDASGRIGVESYEFASDGDLARRGSTIDVLGGDDQLTATGKLVMSAYREGGVMVGIQRDPTVAVERFTTWSLDPSGGTSTTITPNMITTEIFSEDGLHGMCRVPGNAAEGDFLVATGKPAVQGIQLRAFRSGPR